MIDKIYIYNRYEQFNLAYVKHLISEVLKYGFAGIYLDTLYYNYLDRIVPDSSESPDIYWCLPQSNFSNPLDNLFFLNKYPNVLIIQPHINSQPVENLIDLLNKTDKQNNKIHLLFQTDELSPKETGAFLEILQARDNVKYVLANSNLNSLDAILFAKSTQKHTSVPFGLFSIFEDTKHLDMVDEFELVPIICTDLNISQLYLK